MSYYDDHRVVAAMRSRWYAKLDEKRMLALLSDRYDDDESEEEPTPTWVAFKYEVCPTCDGKGSHVNPSIDSHGITAEEWERDWDPDEREAYMSGGYDVPCSECGGCRVVAEPARDMINKALLEHMDAVDADYSASLADERRALKYGY